MNLKINYCLEFSCYKLKLNRTKIKIEHMWDNISVIITIMSKYLSLILYDKSNGYNHSRLVFSKLCSTEQCCSADSDEKLSKLIRAWNDSKCCDKFKLVWKSGASPFTCELCY